MFKPHTALYILVVAASLAMLTVACYRRGNIKHADAGLMP